MVRSAITGITLSLLVAPLGWPDAIAPAAVKNDGNTTVTWGPGPFDEHELIYSLPQSTGFWVRGGTAPPLDLTFFWTTGVDPVTHQIRAHPGYQPFSIQLSGDLTGPQNVHFKIPLDPSIIDFDQNVPADDVSITFAALIPTGTGKKFGALSDSINVPFTIPVFAPTNVAAAPTIYAAVDLQMYQANNPFGFLNGQYAQEETLDALGLSIVNGQIPGVAGMYFSTSPFLIDLASPTGYVPSGGSDTLLNSDAFEAAYGPIAIFEVVNPVPEPGSAALLMVVAGFFLRTVRRVRSERS